MKLKHILLSTMTVFAFFILTGCDSGDGSGDEPKLDCGPTYCISDLVGTWEATEITFNYCGTAMIEPTFVDIIAEGGTATMVVQSSGRFTITITFPNSDSDVVTGRMYFEDGQFFAIQFDDDDPDDPTYFGDTLLNSGNTFRLNGGPETAEFDFDDDGNEECASIRLEFERI